MNKNILVIGKNGQLGQSLFKVIENCTVNSMPNNWIFNFISRDELDLSNLKSIKEFFHHQKFSVIINFAAYTSVDKAENDIELANQINHLAVAKLAEVAKNQEIPLIHISTDYVFHGQEFKSYTETDNTDPQNVYGLTKLKGEQSLIASGCKGAIIRTSWLYSEYGKNFVKTILNLGKENDNIDVVSDQVGSPTYAINLAKAIFTMLNKQQTIKILNSQLNIYHFSDEGICSWYDFAKTIIKISNINCEVNPVKTKDYPSKAKRPNYNVMNKNKIKQHLPDFEIPHWKESLVNCLIEIRKTEIH